LQKEGTERGHWTDNNNTGEEKRGRKDVAGAVSGQSLTPRILFAGGDKRHDLHLRAIEGDGEGKS